MNTSAVITQFSSEFESEIPAAKKCIERVPENIYNFKPHVKSMELGYLVQLVAEIPKWISVMIGVGEIDFQTFRHSKPRTTGEMVDYFNENINAAKQSFKVLTEKQLTTDFVLKNGSHVLMKTPLAESLSSTINHWVHHRGQLTVYMRLNDIAVPSIYGPSADEKGF